MYVNSAVCKIRAENMDVEKLGKKESLVEMKVCFTSHSTFLQYKSNNVRSKATTDTGANPFDLLSKVLDLLQVSELHQDANDKDEFEERSHKRIKVTEPLNVSSASYDLTEEGSLSGRKGVVELEPGKGTVLFSTATSRCTDDEVKAMFDLFIVKYEKCYKTPEEKEKRL
ncbi:hypothetical protein L1987_37722 [Smallanthus sonchifolius]|uniref:Uncharacterized protein n=1 Tax=Smallanthus sonchifolius TaxID=185202 RepID=A0ACB9HID2_9ASTR|nr:hypothetical protein L1987_37722 [Smallanthus sonchifolius]